MKRILSILLLMSGAMAVSAPVLAGEFEHAEHVRLAEEMKKLASRNAWPAVEASYQKMLALAQAGEPLTYDDHWLGAQAARDAGNVTDWQTRLQSAKNVKNTDEVNQSLAEISSSFGTLQITIDSKYVGARALTMPSMPFAPDQVANVRFVASKVKSSTTGYTGLLVAGSYVLDGQAITVEVGKTTTISLLPPKAEPLSVSVGPRLGVGASFTKGSTEQVDFTYATENSLATQGFLDLSGAGGRAYAGAEIAIGPKIGLGLVAGYHALFSGAQVDETQIEGLDQSESMQVFFGEAALGFRVSKLRLEIGPEGGFVLQDGFVNIGGGNIQEIKGTGWVGGATAGLGYQLVSFGNVELSMMVEGGMLYGTPHTYPWGQLGVRIAPSLDN